MMDFQPYPFEKLNDLIKEIPKKDGLISLGIGEPQFDAPEFICNAVCEDVKLFNKYPKTAGEDFLNNAIIEYVKNRFNIEIARDEIVSTFGTREVLFNLPQFLLFNKQNPTIAHPNPFYQIYEGATIASKANSIYMNLTKENGYKPTLSKEDMEKCDVVILNSPNNPTGISLSIDELQEWVENALTYNFVLINDECYSDIYSLNPPCSILEASIKANNKSFKNILAINSISKRSSAPSLRSGFVAGDREILQKYARYRTYVGAASPSPLQRAASLAWRDIKSVEENRQKYKENLQLASEILSISVPSETFYVWLYVGDDLQWTKELLLRENILVLPGSFLSRCDNGINPGKGYVRLALVYTQDIIKTALHGIKKCL